MRCIARYSDVKRRLQHLSKKSSITWEKCVVFLWLQFIDYIVWGGDRWTLLLHSVGWLPIMLRARRKEGFHDSILCIIVIWEIALSFDLWLIQILLFPWNIIAKRKKARANTHILHTARNAWKWYPRDKLYSYVINHRAIWQMHPLNTFNYFFYSVSSNGSVLGLILLLYFWTGSDSWHFQPAHYIKIQTFSWKLPLPQSPREVRFNPGPRKKKKAFLYIKMW